MRKVEKSQPTVRTTGFGDNDTWRDRTCPGFQDLQPQFPPHFSCPHSFLGASMKAMIMCPNKRKISRCFSKRFLTVKGACSAGLFTHPLSLWLLLYDPMSSPKLLQSLTVWELGKVQLWSLEPSGWIEHCSCSAENFFRLRSGHRKLIFKTLSSSSTLFCCEFYRCRGFQEALWCFPSCLIYENEKYHRSPIIFCRLVMRLDASMEIQSRHKE